VSLAQTHSCVTQRTARSPPPRLPYTDVRRDCGSCGAAPGGAGPLPPGALEGTDHSGRADLPSGSRLAPRDGRAFSCEAERPPSVVRRCCMASAGNTRFATGRSLH